MKKLTASLMTMVLLSQVAPAVVAKQKGDWIVGKLFWKKGHKKQKLVYSI